MWREWNSLLGTITLTRTHTHTQEWEFTKFISFGNDTRSSRILLRHSVSQFFVSFVGHFILSYKNGSATDRSRFRIHRAWAFLHTILSWPFHLTLADAISPEFFPYLRLISPVAAASRFFRTGQWRITTMVLVASNRPWRRMHLRVCVCLCVCMCGFCVRIISRSFLNDSLINVSYLFFLSIFYLFLWWWWMQS